MPLEVTVGTTCHVFVVRIGSFLEAPKAGASIVCPTCGKKAEILKVGIPHRVQREEHPDDDSQTSLFEE